MDWSIREAVPDDVGAIDALIHELAEFERSADAVQARPDDLAHALFGPSPLARALVAVSNSAEGEPTVCGCAIWFLTYSTWTGRGGIWLEDLYVTPSRRGHGIGSGLLAALGAQCVGHDLRRLDFSVLDWNTGAQRVYRAAGATPLADWTTWRVEGQALTDLAARHHGPVSPTTTAKGQT